MYSKILRLSALAASHPREAYERARQGWERHRNPKRTPDTGGWPISTLEQVIEVLLTHAPAPIAPDSLSDEISLVREVLNRRVATLPSDAPFSRDNNADYALAVVCYAACRLFAPRYVVETGVAYGVTTTAILLALADNAGGELHSIDLPPLVRGADGPIGYLVPQNIRDQWTLHRGASRQVLPALLERLGPVQVFCHDGLHTFENMKFEFYSVLRRRSGPLVVIADDIHNNLAFLETMQETKPLHWAAVRQPTKQSLYGFALYA